MLSTEDFRKFWLLFSSDIVRDVDGYYIYWPTSNKGFLDGYALKALAEVLDTANYQWNQVVNTHLG